MPEAHPWIDDAVALLPGWAPWASWAVVPLSALAAWLATGAALTLAARPLGALGADAHWTARARASWGVRGALGLSTVVLPFGLAAASLSFRGPLTAAGLVLPWAAGLAAWHGASAHRGRARRLLGLPPLTLAERARDLGVSLFVMYPTLLVTVAGAMLAPDAPGPRLWATGLALALALVALGGGAHLGLAAALGLMRPADAELDARVRALAKKAEVPVRRVWLIEWSLANAFAFPARQSVGFTRRAREALTDGELSAIAAHELGHLGEPRGARVARRLQPLVLAPLVATRAALAWKGAPGVLAVLAAMLLVLTLVRRLARRMEEHADRVAHQHEAAPGDYARALERIYELNRVPAVLRGQGRVHPHLYDRLVAAGVTPAYPRPAPPARWPSAAALAVCALAAFGLAGAAALVTPRLEGGETSMWRAALVGGDASLFESLGYRAWKAGELPTARAHYRATVALRPRHAAPLATLAAIELGLGRCELAGAYAGEAAGLVESRAPDAERARELVDWLHDHVPTCTERESGS